MTRSCLKLRCPACKGRTRLAAEAFAELRRRPTVAVEHTCEHCGHRFPATLVSAVSDGAEKTPARERIIERKAIESKGAMEMPLDPAAFTPKASAAAAAVAPPFGPLGARNDEAARGRNNAAAAAPPFAPGAAAEAPREGKKSFNEWWKSQSPKRQWTFLACIAVMIGAAVLSMPTGEASAASESGAGDKAAVATPNESTKPVDAAKAIAETPKPETKNSANAADEALGLLCQETPALGGRIEQPLAAAIAVEGRGFVVRAAKVFADLHNAGGSTAKWFVATPTKRYKVKGVKFHPEFPAEKLKALAAKGAQKEMLDLIKAAERSDVAFIETTEAPASSMALVRDPAAISGKPLEIATPADVKAAKGQAIAVKFSRKALTPEMLKEDGAGLESSLAVGCDAVVATKEGVLAAFVPRKNLAGTATHPIVPAETLAELLGAK